jgi:LPS-assembly lipoprotein
MRTETRRSPKHWCARRTLLLWALILLSVLFSIQGCGWRLRGSMDVSLHLPPLYLEVNGSQQLQRELKRSLKVSGIQLTESRDAAELILNVTREGEDRRVSSVDRSGKISEYELLYTLEFKVMDKEGVERLPLQEITQQRTYSFSEQDVLAKGDEQARLFETMRLQAVRALVRRLQGLQNAAPVVVPNQEAAPHAN